MVELTDPVTCRCGSVWDRAYYSQCAHCTRDLWDESNLIDPGPPEQEPVPRVVPGTVLEGVPPTPGVDLLVCGRRLTVDPGSVLALGRDEDLETESVFRAAMNISRHHADLRYDGGRLYITDTNSSNGTFVNDQRLPAGIEYELRQGQTLRLASNVAIEIRWPS